MLSSATLLRGLRSSSRLQCRRYASHEAPQYNEPSGWLFGEKVGDTIDSVYRLRNLYVCLFVATPTGSEKSERGLGESLVHWNVWHNGFRFRDVIL
jgi:hypothetical protein